MFEDDKMSVVLLKARKKGDNWMVFSAVLELDEVNGEKLGVNKNFKC